ncbi:hypothetical protein QBC38DRAFT_241159 [Podospora fimiseda]|uniref:Uncharacterized protein n=1 Tax=Podospora fimiseda TaxID=252190 RepID=A0AAN7BMJ9_9PEZI|nr:hypothetical protein QBC38DRAFT_241159 [Podospora fimiseda]
MDAANMIKEEKLKKGFMLATLASTIAGTFITSINLYDRVVDQRRQHKMDRSQNKKIKELEGRLTEAAEEKRRIQEAKEQEKRSKKKRRDHDSDSDSSSESDHDRDLRRSLERGGSSIQREFDRYMRNMGSKFAQGDLIAQTQLQSQIIILQSSVIQILEEALLTGNPPDISRLYNTSEFAREGSIRALQDQYHRMILQKQQHHPGSSSSSRRGLRPNAPIRRISSTPSLRGSDAGREQQKYLPPPPPVAASTPLFCQYAQDLQNSSSCQLKHQCPACHVILDNPSEPPSSWRIEKRVIPRSRDRSPSSRRGSSTHDEDYGVITRSFILTPRFMAKCHRQGPGSGYACFLCVCHRDRDTICRSEEGLVNHIASKHGVSEYLDDRDIKEAAKSLPYR